MKGRGEYSVEDENCQTYTATECGGIVESGEDVQSVVEPPFDLHRTQMPFCVRQRPRIFHKSYPVPSIQPAAAPSTEPTLGERKGSQTIANTSIQQHQPIAKTKGGLHEHPEIVGTQPLRDSQKSGHCANSPNKLNAQRERGECPCIIYSPSEKMVRKERQASGLLLAAIFVVLTLLAVAVVALFLLVIWREHPYATDLNRMRIDSATGTNSDYEPSLSPTISSDPGSIQLNACNGHKNLCGIRINKVLFATVHNAMSSLENGFFLPNHAKSLERALEAGYRGINLDIGKCNNSLTLVHGKCTLGTRNLHKVWSNIVAFLSLHPSEVIIMPIQVENDAGGGPVSLHEIAAVMKSVPGFTELLYNHPGHPHPWPTLETLIKANRRILFFQYNGIERCSDTAGVCMDGMQDWFTYAVETPFEFTTPEELQDSERSCSLERGVNGLKDFYSLNLFTSVPSSDSCQKLNNAKFVKEHLKRCEILNSFAPNLLAVDCWETGDVLSVVKEHNAAIKKPGSSSAIFGIDATGVESLMTQQDTTNFQRICISFFGLHLMNVNNVDCSVQQQALVLPTEGIARSDGVTSLWLLVKVSGEGNAAAGGLFTSSDLRDLVFGEKDELTNALRAVSNVFARLDHIEVDESSSFTSPMAGPPLAVPIETSAKVPTTSFFLTKSPRPVPSLVDVATTGSPTSLSTRGAVHSLLVSLETNNSPTQTPS